MHYELWDTETGNQVGDYDTEAEALGVVFDSVNRRGPSIIESLALGLEHGGEGGDDEAVPPILSGAPLLARAQDATRERRPARGCPKGR